MLQKLLNGNENAYHNFGKHLMKTFTHKKQFIIHETSYFNHYTTHILEHFNTLILIKFENYLFTSIISAGTTIPSVKRPYLPVINLLISSLSSREPICFT